MVGNEERPQCVMCLKIFTSDSMMSNKLRHHLEPSHHKMLYITMMAIKKKNIYIYSFTFVGHVFECIPQVKKYFLSEYQLKDIMCASKRLIKSIL